MMRARVPLVLAVVLVAGGFFHLGLGSVATPAMEAAAQGAPPAARSGLRGSAPQAVAMPPLPAIASTFGRAYGMRPGSAFMQGLLGGLLGAGVAGWIAGNGFFSALVDAPGVLGILLQLLLIYGISLGLWRLLRRSLAPAGGELYTRFMHPGIARAAPVLRPRDGAARGRRPIFLDERDSRSFEELLHCMQSAWCAHDLHALQSMTTEPMANAYAEQITAQDARGEHDVVSALTLERQDVLDAWTDGEADFATVKLRYAMLDVTVDMWGRVVAGSPDKPVLLTERWSFVRSPRGHWRVSAIEA